ncbi:MAG: metallophosphoesterase family protein [Pseudolabrys sp.]
MTFVLAHLSDPHLAPLPQPQWLDLLNKRITGYVNWRRKRRFVHDPDVLARIVADLKAQMPDHIAVTGDIANLALPEEFVRGRAWLQQLGAGTDVSFVPGNHDMYVKEAVRLMPSAFGNFMTSDMPGVPLPYVRRRQPLAIVGVSSGVPTAPFLATGWVGAEQLITLRARLEALRDEGLFRVVMIHHPPITQAANHKRLLDAQVFLRVIAEAGAELVLHGHDHVHAFVQLKGPNGPVPAMGVPSASAAPGGHWTPAAYNLYRIGGGPGAWTCEAVSRGLDDSGNVVELGTMNLTAG